MDEVRHMNFGWLLHAGDAYCLRAECEDSDIIFIPKESLRE